MCFISLKGKLRAAHADEKWAEGTVELSEMSLLANDLDMFDAAAWTNTLLPARVEYDQLHEDLRGEESFNVLIVANGWNVQREVQKIQYGFVFSFLFIYAWKKE